jgi:hypothetical protein
MKFAYALRSELGDSKFVNISQVSLKPLKSIKVGSDEDEDFLFTGFREPCVVIAGPHYVRIGGVKVGRPKR